MASIAARMSEQQEQESYTWRVQLWARNPAKLMGIFLASCLAALVGYTLFHQILVALVGFLAISAATAEFWLPQIYRLDRNGATVRSGISVTAINWCDIKRVIPDEIGVKLSPLVGEGRMGAFRGVYLRFADNREEVLNFIERSCTNNLRPVGS